MNRRRGEIQIFSVSFLDVLSCALGGVLILLLLNMESAANAARSYAEQAKSMREQIQQALHSLRAAKSALAQAQADAEAQRKAREAMELAQTALIGLKGDMKGVVFIFDTSGSMEGPRFDEYREILKDWIANLTFEQFNVINFDSSVVVWRAGSMINATEQNRSGACTFVDGLRAKGSTDTLGALEAAFGLPGVDTIVLMSDGAPNQPFDTIHVYLQQANASQRVVINTVGMGHYFQASYGSFLQKIASDHGGMFIGR